MDLTSQNVGTAAKDWLSSREKYVGWGFTGLGCVVGLVALFSMRVFLNNLLDFTIGLLGRALAIGALGFLAVILVMLAMNPRTYTELWHVQAGIARWVSNWAMKRDPFGRMRAFAHEYLGEQFEKFNAASVRIQAQLQTITQKMVKYEARLTESKLMTETLAQRHRTANDQWDTDENRDAFRLESQRILFTEQSLKKLRVSHATLTALVKIVDRWRNTFKFEIESTQMSADFLEQEYNQANETAGALEAAKVVFGHGDMAKADLEVREYIEKMTASRMAQADVLMKQIPELTSLGDLKGDIAEDQILARLQKLDAASQQAFVEVQEDRRQIESGGSAQIVDSVKAKVLEPVGSRRRYLS